MMIAVDSAPLENGIVDLLVPSVEIESSDSYLSNEMAQSLLREDISQEENINRRQYEGYIFNQNRCIQFNDRILCGYDKNKGSRLDDYTMLDVGNGCRARGDRIECGYDNPRLYKNLRRPAVENEHGGHVEQDENGDHGKHGESGEHVEQDENGDHGEPVEHSDNAEQGEHDGNSDHDAQQEENHHNVGYRHHDGYRYREDNHDHRDQHHGSLVRQAPTRTAMPTDPTTQSILFNKFKSDCLENKLLKSAFNKLALNAEETSLGKLKTNMDLIDPTTLSIDTVKPLTTTTAVPTKRKSTLTSRSTQTSLTTTTSATSSESNSISDGETLKRIVKLAPVSKNKRRQLTKILSTLPKLLSASKLNGTVAPIANSGKAKISRAPLRIKSSSEEKVTAACVEQQDRVVCYNFKT